jgi:hypothetical protein
MGGEQEAREPIPARKTMPPVFVAGFERQRSAGSRRIR